MKDPLAIAQTAIKAAEEGFKTSGYTIHYGNINNDIDAHDDIKGYQARQMEGVHIDAVTNAEVLLRRARSEVTKIYKKAGKLDERGQEAMKALRQAEDRMLSEENEE